MYMASRVAVCTTLGACGGGTTALILHTIHHGIPEMIASLNGILGGLVSVTAGCAYMEPYMALRMKIDDPVDACAVHLACGSWGLLAVGLFASPKYVENSEFAGVFFGGNGAQLGIQLLGASVIFIWASFWTGVAFLTLFHLGWLRV
eukprot:scaffold33048_cov38-Prasinocladus_malaysianus.AAC.1